MNEEDQNEDLMKDIKKRAGLSFILLDLMDEMLRGRKFFFVANFFYKFHIECLTVNIFIKI